MYIALEAMVTGLENPDKLKHHGVYHGRQGRKEGQGKIAEAEGNQAGPERQGEAGKTDQKSLACWLNSEMLHVKFQNSIRGALLPFFISTSG